MNTSTWILFIAFAVIMIIEVFFLNNEYISYQIDNKLCFKENKFRKLINLLSSLIFLGVIISSLFEGGFILVLVITLPILVLISIQWVKSNKSSTITFDLNSRTLVLKGKEISFKEFKELHFVEVIIPEWPTTYSIKISTFDEHVIDLLNFNKYRDADIKFNQIHKILEIEKKHIVDRGLLKPIVK